MKSKNIILLGATGSIGSSTLNLIRQKRDHFNIVGISADKRIDQLKNIADEFNVKKVCYNKNHTNTIFSSKTKIMTGNQGLIELASLDCDLVVSGISGLAGLMPAISAIDNGNDIAIANKEPLVVAGKILKASAKKNNSKILPVDSEHNSIFQCFNESQKKNISHITITASGGPFLHREINTFGEITVDQALKHPNWKMGKKISIDSATLINKALEVIEAGILFELNANQIEVIIHPESIVHGLVHYKDGSVLANLGLPDMISPLSVAIAFPNRYNLKLQKLDLIKISKLNFLKPDSIKFPGLDYGWQALRGPDYFSTILNASNEIAVNLFLNHKIKFNNIIDIIDHCLNTQTFQMPKNLHDYLEIDKLSRNLANKYSERFYV